MSAREIDDVDFVATETAGVEEKKEMQPANGYRRQNGCDPGWFLRKITKGHHSHELFSLINPPPWAAG
jgi:hypothetical protein